MRDLNELNKYRITDPVKLDFTGGWPGDATCGAFIVPSPIDRQPLVVMASANGGWDHVSVSRQHRVPNWREMEMIAGMFFKDQETAVQYHVPREAHINIHPNVLHWWRPRETDIPLPPRGFV